MRLHALLWVTIFLALGTHADAGVNRADFNGDGHDDLVWRRGNVVVAWYMNGTARIGDEVIASEAASFWRIVGSGDFDSDGNVDLVWEGDSGAVCIWLMKGTALRESAYPTDVIGPPSLDYQIAGVGDFDLDGHPDLVWRSETRGLVVIWFMNGTQRRTTMYYSHADGQAVRAYSDWQLELVADLDGNGKPDLVWRSRVDGAVVVYFSNPGAGIWYTQAISTSVLAVVPDLNWRIVAAGDYNNDGSVDLVWRHSVTGANVVWFMQGGSRIGTATLSDGTISDRYWGIVVPR